MNAVNGTGTMNQRVDRIVLLLMVVNVLMVLFGAFDLVWQVRREAARPTVPTNLAALESARQSG